MAKMQAKVATEERDDGVKEKYTYHELLKLLD